MPHFDSEYEQKLYADRVAKLDRIAEIGARLGLSRAESLYPNTFRFTHTVPELLALGASKSAEELEAEPIQAAVAGRVMSHRAQGKAGFAHLQQAGWTTGADGLVRPTDAAERLQIYARKDDIGANPEQSEALFALYKLLDLGDHIGVRGTLMRTRTGELTLKLHPLPSATSSVQPGLFANSTLADQIGRPALEFLGKAMLALPDKYHGLEDVELRYRQRYADLIMNSGTLAKAEGPNPGMTSSPSEGVILSGAQRAESKDPRISPEAPQPPTEATDALPFLSSRSEAEVSASPGPGASAVTDSATPNSQHEDAPRNVREVFVKRAAILRAIRRFFDACGYLEVETPMMHTVAGGAAARPFKTHHNALDIPLSLRIAPELFLKRLVVGGMDRVYEINRNFRNEGISTQHNPEFTMLEFYQAYANYHDLMDLTVELIESVALEVNGTTIAHFNGHEIDLAAANWTKLSMREAIVKFWPEGFGRPPDSNDLASEDNFAVFLREALLTLQVGYPQISTPTAEVVGVDIERHRYRRSLLTIFNGHRLLLERDRADVLHNFAKSLGFALPEGQVFVEPEPVGRAIASIFEAVAERNLTQPTIIYDFPLAVSPLSKVKPDEPDWVERFEFYIGGFEVGNAFSELNDAADQEARFEAQVADKDPESMSEVDHDYVRALGYGLPPTAGEGIGIDRLTMLLTGSRSIRDVILFPLLRPETKQSDPEPGEDSDNTYRESAE